jgi:cutinase
MFKKWPCRMLCIGAATAVTLLGAVTGTAAASSPVTAPFTECPAIGAAPSCEILLDVNANRSIQVLGDSSVGPYDGSDDTLVGVVNNSSSAVQAITVSGPSSGLAGFDGDGICTYATGGITGGSGPGFNGDSYCDAQQLSGTDPEDYEGPDNTFTLDPKSLDDVEVDFNGKGLAPGQYTYFSLEGSLTAAAITSQVGTLACDPVYFIGARGSGQSGPGSKSGWDKGTDPTGFGPEVDDVYTKIQNAFGAGNVQADPLSYAADPVPSFTELVNGNAAAYFTDLSAGVSQAITDLTKQAASCPGQEIIMAGYSQGAMVLHRVLHQLGSQILSRVAVAVLVADGDQVAFDNEVNDGSAWPWAYGVGQVDKTVSGTSAARFSNSLRTRVIRVCDRGDLVCDFGTAIDEDLAKAAMHDLNYKDYLKGAKIHGSYPGSKPLLQAAGQAVKDAQKLGYYGGVLNVTGTAGQPISKSAVVIGGKAPLTVFVGLDPVPSWLELGVSGNNVVTLGGTPSGTGSWRFDVVVQDAANKEAIIPVSLTVR